MKTISVMLIVLVLSGCGDSAEQNGLASDLTSLKTEVAQLRAEIARLKELVSVKPEPVVSVSTRPQAKRGKLFAHAPTVLDDTGEELRKRLGVPKDDWEKVYTGFDQRLDPLEWRVRQMQKLVDTLVKTVELIPAE